ncbi:MAG TPA: cytochrome P460 family protein [Dongiaceae bacterium]|nr:cytochrome P460 family protein [Dongiaceae bacterium]
MKRILCGPAGFAAIALAALAGTLAALAPAAGQAKGDAADATAAIAAGTLLAGYRDWRLVSVAHEEGKLSDLRAILGNDAAIAAFGDRQIGQAGGRPFPDGTVIARLAWDYEKLPEGAAAFGQAQSYVAVHPKNGVQFMVKDARKYAATGGWGFAQFNDGKPVAAAALQPCFACHETVKARDFVFTRYAP